MRICNSRISKIIATIFVLILGVINSFSQNPISPPGTFIADPEARFGADGKLYIYGSLDESENYWCSHSYHVLSTKDILHWNIDLNTFSSQGKNDQVAYSDKLLWAPDCANRNGTYYLYYCMPGMPYIEGVATSKSPNGPFLTVLISRGQMELTRQCWWRAIMLTYIGDRAHLKWPD